MRRAAVLSILLLLTARDASAQSPSADWRTISTPHFRVHFRAEFADWAAHVAGEIEAIHTRVTALVGYTPPGVIDVIVSDPASSANGMAIPYLDRPEILLWTSPPGPEEEIAYTDWMELLATHELAHIVHLARPRNRSRGILSRLSPAPFGPLALGSPRWLVEGYATLVEGALTGSGRPASSLRAMVLRQFAIEGKLPSYAELGRTGGWLRGSMAYLVGSAFLEWLSQRESSEALTRLWRRMASFHGIGFSASFRGVFGESPQDLYARFCAETTARALEEERRLKAAGLLEGELWQRLRGGTAALEVSPDGTRLMARRDPTSGESFLAIWEIAESEEERRTEEERRRREAGRLRDPNEVPDRSEEPRPRAPRWTLPRANGFAAADPRWLPGGRSVLFARRAPDAEGLLRWDLYRWDFERGAVVRLTRRQDVLDGDPARDGRWAVAVRSRFGATGLVRVDLAGGGVRALSVSIALGERWPVWSHPRFSPDGRSIAALLHASGRWRVVTLSAEGGLGREWEVSGTPVAAPTWDPDGSRLWLATDASGIWNVCVAAPRDDCRARTRVTGGAFSPSPTPDGQAVFFLELTSPGVDIRKLDLSLAAPAAIPDAEELFPILPPRPQEPTSRSTPAPLPASRPYGVWASQAVRPLVNFSVGPNGDAVQLGIDGDDVLGRFHWLVAGSMGDAVGPRGGTLAVAYRGLPVAIAAQVFSAIERPGRQSLAARPELDQERRGGHLGLSWGRPVSGGRLRVEMGGGGTRVRALSSGEEFDRFVGSAAGELSWRRVRGRSGFGFDVRASGELGRTGDASWSHFGGGARLVGIAPFASASFGGRWGGSGGAPSRFDLFAVGGAPSTILPQGLDRNRIESPAVPAAAQLGRRFEAYRAELAAGGAPVLVYGEWLRAWNGDAPRPHPIRVIGLEARLEELIPSVERNRPISFHVGLARIHSDAPRIRATRGYAGLIYRP